LRLAINFLGTNPNSIPIIGPLLVGTMGTQHYSVLVIGDPIPENLDMVYTREQYPTYTFKGPMLAKDLKRKNVSSFKQYNYIILDQTGSDDKSIPGTLAKALSDYVFGGGNLIIVGNSGYRETGRADILGWVSVLGDKLAPVDCPKSEYQATPCETGVGITGMLKINVDNVKEFAGMEQIPASTLDASSLPFTTYDVPLHNNAEEWYYLKDMTPGGKTYEGVDHIGTFIGGDVVYFNYDQLFLTPGLLKKVFEKIR